MVYLAHRSRALGYVSPTFIPEWMADNVDPSTGLNFDVIGYRGSPVATRDGWVADVKSRGGFVTHVPGGFFHDLDAARFGTAPPYAYELQPIWLMILNGVDIAAQEFQDFFDYQGLAEAADNQVQSLHDIIATVPKAAAAIPDALKWIAIAGAVLLAFEALSFVPRPARRA